MLVKKWADCPGGPALLQCLCFFCLAVVSAQLALAGAAAPYGEYFVRLGERWPDAGTVAPQPETNPGSDPQDSASYQRQLSQLEDEGGPYADTLAEPLAALARLYRRQGDIGRAQQTYQRALHLVRINEGLNSERQVPILRELFVTDRMNGDMATLDGRYDYFFRLFGSGRPPYTPVRLSAALEYLRWQREALRLGLDGNDTARLLALYSLNEELLQGVALDPRVDLASYRALVQSQLRNLYLLRDGYQPLVESNGIGPGLGITLPDVADEQDIGQHRLEIIQRNALARGRALLEELINRTPPDRVEALAGAWLELGDWNQWNDHRPEALAAYSQVADLLRGAGREELLQQWLGQPAELPANGAFWQPRPIAAEAKPIVVRASYDVTASGRARNIEVTALDSEDQSKASRVRRLLAQTRFRPRIVDGEPQAELQLQRDYEVLD